MYAEAMEKLIKTSEELSEVQQELGKMREICSLMLQGATVEEIAGKYGITEAEVRALVDGKKA